MRIGQALFDGIVCKIAVPIARQTAAVRPDPECSVAADKQRLNIIAFYFRRVSRIESRKTHAVKTHHAFGNRQPQITVGRLHNRADAVLRQTVLVLLDKLPVTPEKFLLADNLTRRRKRKKTN